MPQYRQATPDDLPGICALGEEVNRLHCDAWPRLFAKEIAAESQRQVWSESLCGENAAVFVAVEGQSLVGFVTIAVVDEASPFFRAMRYAKVGSICVTEMLRGQGIGRRLMEEAEIWARVRNAVEVHLNVWSFNERARALYEELGYEIRSHYMGKGLSKPEA
ncbi:GNAT family N-acetyltransferase [uncultured Piscinibacter sp.]|uniref:GNAT family N-acetyltransferase n=1 Tax=uncultured Piscinibacter sp. TaxID=1131835 RepID=UPI0026380E1A|nr:GNAT family N-acetyltransferase [uncultured Piscinibacter sp.]